MVKLRDFPEERLQKAATDEGALGVALQQTLAEVSTRTGVRVQLLRPMLFGWGLFRVSAPDGGPLDEVATEKAVATLRADKAVAGASADRWMRPLLTPNDPGLQYMWHFTSVNATATWDMTTGLASQTVGVVDSGTWRTHNDLSGKDLAGYDFISFTEASADGDARDADYADPGDGGDCGYGPQPDSWHGSHVAGTILANANDGLGVPGLNWNARLITGRAIGRCGGALSDILEAMAWMAGYSIPGVPSIGQNATKVINLSLGSDQPCSSTEQDYVSTISSQTGAVFIAAVGNSGNNVPVGSPASCNNVIGVAAHGPGNGRPLTNYSNFGNGSGVDVVAPGGQIYDQQGNGGVLSLCGGGNDCWNVLEGTSMASPHVAGIVSLMLSVNPQLSSSQVLTLLQQTGESCTNCGGKVAVRADAAVQSAIDAPGGSPNPTPGPSCGNECASLQYTACTCGADDPCGWVGDGTCDADCSQVTNTPFDDAADCGGGGTGGGGTGGGGTGGGGTGGGGTGGAACDLRRGNWDCPNREGCVDDGNGDNTGYCLAGAFGEKGSGGLCDDDDDCASGLCDRGVCTVPCDDGDCRDGYACDAEAIPGGLCRAESCADSRGDICETDWYCTYSDARRYVCAKEGEPAFGGLCACTRTFDFPPLGGLVSLAGFALLYTGRRRRRRV